VRGNRAKLSGYTSEDIIASADVGMVNEAGEHDLDVTVSFPPSSGFSVVSQSLDSIKVSIDKLTSVEFDVDVNIVNAQYDTDAFALGKATVSPSKVTVKGPQKVLASISNACVNLDLGSINSTIGFNNRILLIDSNNEEIDSPYISLSNQYAEGTVPFIGIEEASKIVEKSVPLVCSFKYGYYNNTNCSVSITPQFVTISGSEKDVSKIESIDVFNIDETKITGNTVFSVAIKAPEATTLVDAKKNAVVSVNVSDNVSSAQFDVDDVRFDKLDNDLSAKPVVPFKVTLLGDANAIDNLRDAIANEEDAFIVAVDMSLVKATGKYKLPISVEFLLPGYKNVWCEFAEITVEVE
jgi:YbbR domain-containing protein